MQVRAARALQRLALTAGLCAGAWVAAEGLDHGTASADDVPVRVEETAPARIRGGGWGVSDSPRTGATTPVRDRDRDKGNPSKHPPRPQPLTPPATPIRDVVDDILDGVLPTPTETPEPAAGGGSPQRPADAPPAPAAPTAPPTADLDMIPGLPGTPEVIEVPALFGGEHIPAPYVPTDVQTDTRTGGPVCDSRGVTPATQRPDTRGQPEFPRASADPGPTPPANPCDPDGDGRLDEMPTTPASYSGDQALVGSAAITRVWVLDLHRDDPGHDRHDDALPRSWITLWPTGPG